MAEGDWSSRAADNGGNQERNKSCLNSPDLIVFSGARNSTTLTYRAFIRHFFTNDVLPFLEIDTNPTDG